MKTLREYAMRFVGRPYLWGGDDAVGGFDCSGLVIELLQSCGELPAKYDNTAQGLYNEFCARPGGVCEAGFGALVFFGKGVDKITHVGFMLDDFRMLEAGGGGSRTRSVADAIAQNAVVRVRPFDFRRDMVEILKPRYFNLQPEE